MQVPPLTSWVRGSPVARQRAVPAKAVLDTIYRGLSVLLCRSSTIPIWHGVVNVAPTSLCWSHVPVELVLLLHGNRKIKNKSPTGCMLWSMNVAQFCWNNSLQLHVFKLWEILPPANRVILVLLYKQVTSGTWWTTLHSAFVFPLVLTYYITIHSTEANRKNGVQHFF